MIIPVKYDSIIRKGSFYHAIKADGFDLYADKDYAVRYTLKYQGEGGTMQINMGSWGTNAQDTQVLAEGPIYTHMVQEFPGWSADASGAHVMFQSGDIAGRMIVEKVEVFDITPDYSSMNFSDLLVEDFEGDADANTNFLSKLVLGHSEEEVDEDGEKTGNRITVIDDDDPEILPAVKSAVAANWIAEGEEVELGNYGISLAVKQLPEGGTEYDSQFFIRLPKALPADALVNVEFDYWASNSATVNTVAQSEPGQNVEGGKGLGSIAFAQKKWQHFQKYVKVSADMRTIAFNISVAGATYRFDNFKIQIAEDFVDAADELTETMDETSLWEGYELPLNEKINEAKNIDTEGYTEESVQALEDAIQAAKEALAPGEDDPATAESLSDAKAALEAAIAGLEKDEPDAIDGIAAGAAVKDGKYFINGQIVIVKGGKKYNAAGVEIK